MRLVQLGVYVDDLFSFVYLCGSDVCAVWWGYSRVASSAKLFGLYTTLYNTGCVLRFSIRVSPPAHTHIGCAAVHTHTHGLSRSPFSNSPVPSLPAGIWCWEKRWEFKWAFSSALWCARDAWPHIYAKDNGPPPTTQLAVSTTLTRYRPPLTQQSRVSLAHRNDFRMY